MEEQGHCGSENLDLAGSAGTIDLHHLLLPKALTPCEALIQVVALLVVKIDHQQWEGSGMCYWLIGCALHWHIMDQINPHN